MDPLFLSVTVYNENQEFFAKAIFKLCETLIELDLAEEALFLLEKCIKNGEILEIFSEFSLNFIENAQKISLLLLQKNQALLVPKMIEIFTLQVVIFFNRFKSEMVPGSFMKNAFEIIFGLIRMKFLSQAIDLFERLIGLEMVFKDFSEASIIFTKMVFGMAQLLLQHGRIRSQKNGKKLESKISQDKASNLGTKFLQVKLQNPTFMKIFARDSKILVTSTL